MKNRYENFVLNLPSVSIGEYADKISVYTDINGNHVSNRARRNTQELSARSMIQNGCGGTRAAYGTAVLLRTTAALLDIIGKINSGQICKSTLWDITPGSVIASDLQIQMEGCDCCGL